MVSSQTENRLGDDVALDLVGAAVDRHLPRVEIERRDGIGPIVTEIVSAEGVPYFLAEEYHQKYLKKNPNGYDCHSSTGVAFPQLSNS